MDIKKQQYLLEVLLSSTDVFGRCVSMLKPDYFDGDLRKVTGFILEYFDKYKALPDIDIIDAEFDITFSEHNLNKPKAAYACEEIEIYCQQSAVAVAMEQSIDDLQEGNLGAILERMREALSVSLMRDLGWEFFDKNFADRFDEAQASQATISTGLAGLDVHLGGGLSPQQLTLFTANSGVGKSIMLNNLAYNYAAQGYHSVVLSLELPRPMLFNRTTAIVSGYDVQHLADHRSDVISTVDNIRPRVDGSLTLERIRGDASTNDIRSYLTQYELENGYPAQALFVDYIDKMTPNQGVGKLNVSEQDKAKSEQLAELVFDNKLISATASQQNREAIGNASPRQDVIAGGITKVNTVDNHISLYMDEQMRMRGEMIAHFLKTRSASGVGKSSQLHFDLKSLRITDGSSASNNGLFDISKKEAQFVRDTARHLPGNDVDTDDDYVRVDQNNNLQIDTNTPQKKPTEQSELLNFMEEL